MTTLPLSSRSVASTLRTPRASRQARISLGYSTSGHRARKSVRSSRGSAPSTSRVIWRAAAAGSGTAKTGMVNSTAAIQGRQDVIMSRMAAPD
ncbi:MAG: hypothetical protein ACK558_14670, partial [Pseudomonadota bacterium]